MAREILLLDQHKNRTLRLAFLFPVPQVTRIRRQTEGMTVPAPVDPLPPETPKSVGAMVHYTTGGMCYPGTPADLDPVLARLLTDAELAAIADGSLVSVINTVQLAAEDSRSKMLDGTSPALAEIRLMYQQQLADFQDVYQKRSRYLGIRLDASV